jgi:hypothetical protein
MSSVKHKENLINNKKKLEKLGVLVRRRLKKRNISLSDIVTFDNFDTNKKKVIRKIILNLAKLGRCWSKKKAWKKFSMKNFFNKFVIVNQEHMGPVPLKLKKSKSKRFTNKSLKIVARRLKITIFNMHLTHNVLLTNTLKMLGLKKWNRILMPSNLTFTQFLRKYVLRVIECNPSRQFIDWSSDHKRFRKEEGICYSTLSSIVFKCDESFDNICPICRNILPEDPNEVFTPICEVNIKSIKGHSICYNCSREGFSYLYQNGIYKCPMCRKTSTINKIIHQFNCVNDEEDDERDDAWW